MSPAAPSADALPWPLAQLLENHTLVVVSNREPFQFYRDDKKLYVERTSGGLVSALDPVLQRCKGVWICWEGSIQFEDITFDEILRLAQLNGVRLPYQIRTVHLSEEEIQRYYNGFSNGNLWPLFHYAALRYAFDEQDWQTYVQVNQKFAQRVFQSASPEDFIWIQDYHLMPLPQMIREQWPKANLAFFCHIPFPHYEVFRFLPTRRELLLGMLGSDLIGFHTPQYARYFIECVQALLGDEVSVIDETTLRYQSRQIQVRACPIGIDFQAIEEAATTETVDQAVAQLKASFSPAQFIGLGVDRLDYTKGILERLDCVALFFERYPQYCKQLVFIQIAVPSRTHVHEYQRMKQEIDEAVGRINGRFSQEGWAPVHYLCRGFPLEELVAYYRAADFALVNPLRDGMNLVAKEYCAAQIQHRGALILSEMTGAAFQLKQSYLVNPFDHPAVVEAIYSALTAPLEERESRMKSLRHHVAEHDIHAWLQQFLQQFQNSTLKRFGGPA